MARDWHAWHEAYDDPASSLSRRLVVVREALGVALAERTGPVRLLSLCSGDGRDTLPVLAASAATGADVSAVLVELDPELAATARRDAAALDLDVDVRTDDAGLVAAWADVVPVDVLVLCGVLGNVSEDDARATVRGAAVVLQRGGTLIWTRAGEPSQTVRDLLLDAGWEELAYVRPDDASYRVGVHRWQGTASGVLPDRLFTFVP